MLQSNKAGEDRYLKGDLDRLVQRAGRVLRQAYLGTRSRQVLCRMLALSFLFAMPMLAVELLRYLAGYPPFGWSWWQYAALAAGTAIVFGLGWLFRDVLVHIVPRGRTLGLFDRQLELADRLTTADEFIGAGERTGFMRAAIDDAVEPVRRAMGSEARADGSDRRWPLSRGALLSVPATLCLLALTVWLGGLQRVDAAGEWAAGPLGEASMSPDPSVVAALEDEALREEEVGPASEDSVADKTPGAEPGETADAGVPESFDSSGSQPGGQPALQQSESEPSAGQPSGGVPSGAGSREAGQAAGGQQSASSRESVMGEQNQQAASERQQSAGQQQSGATESSGQQSANQSGDSAGSESAAGGDQSMDSGQESMAGSESSATQMASAQTAQSASQQAANQQTANQQAAQQAGQPQNSQSGQAQDQGVNDSAGGGPAPQNLGQGQMSGLSDGGAPQSGGDPADGRSDANDAIKKNRGAATALLAVPKPDRLIGVRGEGPEQIRQERSVPQEQQAPPVAANARSARGERIGTLQQTEVSGWSRQLVKNYFDRAGGSNPGDGPSTTTDSSEGQQP